MSTQKVNEALSQVRRLQAVFMSRQRFRGYSGPARMISGCLALVIAFLLANDFVYTHPLSYLKAWGCLLLLSLVLNYASLARWFWFDPKVKREMRHLYPALEAIPPLIIGAVLSLALIQHQLYYLLYGTWMCLFGGANIASRHVMPRGLGWVGLFYLIAGTVCLLHPDMTFFNPWPMGFVFFIGEAAGGLLLYADTKRGELE